MGNGIDQYTNNPELTAAGTAADTATDTLTQYQTASQMLPEALKSAINEKLDYNKSAIEQKNKSMVDYFNAPSQARVDYQDIFNPFQREALVQKATNNAYIPYQTNTEVLAQRMGTISDIINQATGAFGAQVTSAQGAASAAENKYARLFGLAGAKSDVAYKKASLARSGGGDDALSFAKYMAGQYKATAQQEKDANSALSGLDAVSRIKSILSSPGGETAKAMWNRGLLTAVLGGKEGRQYRDAAKEAYDALMRTRTGAALNMDEEAFYKNYVPTATDDPQTTQVKLQRLDEIYNRTIKTAENPWLDILNQYGQEEYGVGGGSNDTVTQSDGTQWKRNSDGSYTRIK